ncbi:MAG: T9SS type A sorting domain-containing protein [Flavobacteriales bacterium]|nr:T9SS type A sorting domain-containing protein [Flavobacteriales bacterium]
MKNKDRVLLLTTLLFCVLSGAVRAQTPPGACFYSEGFEGEDALAAWDLGGDVEVLTPAGAGTGEFVPAWRISTAEEANIDGYFPVVDQPAGNRSVTANDAAAPCNCNMDNVVLTSPVFDFSSRSNMALELRIFNEMAYGSGSAIIEADRGDDNWVLLDTLPVMSAAWQSIFVDLSTFDNETAVRMRFRWSDGGAWASGFAFDDLCIRERLSNDLSVLRAYANDATVSPFFLGDQSLQYYALPLEQAGELTVASWIRNSGITTLQNVSVSATLNLAGSDVGTFTSTLDSLSPNEQVLVRIPTGHVPDQVGQLEVAFVATADGTDEQLDDNTGSYSMRITGAGWDNGYSAMAVDDGVSQGNYGDTSVFVLANRMELLVPGSRAEGMSVLLGLGTNAGEVVRAILFDENFTFLDTAIRHTVSSLDLDNASAGLPLYFPYTDRPTLGSGDVFVGLQHLPTDGSGRLEVQMGGSTTLGTSVLQQGTLFDITYLYNTPLIRLFLGEVGVGVPDPALGPSSGIRAYPVPMDDHGRIEFDLVNSDTKAYFELLDAGGRKVLEKNLDNMHSGKRSFPLDPSGLAPGVYMVVLRSANTFRTGRILITH